MTEIKIACKNCSREQIVVVGGSTYDTKCRSCNQPLFEVSDVGGFVYVLSNPSMSGLLKIGYTQRQVEERVNELSNSTSVPESFVIECYFTCENPQGDETRIHQNLLQYRYSKDREFFKVDFNDALAIIKKTLNKEPHFIQKHRDEMWLKQEEKAN